MFSLDAGEIDFAADLWGWSLVSINDTLIFGTFSVSLLPFCVGSCATTCSTVSSCFLASVSDEDCSEACVETDSEIGASVGAWALIGALYEVCAGVSTGADCVLGLITNLLLANLLRN